MGKRKLTNRPWLALLRIPGHGSRDILRGFQATKARSPVLVFEASADSPGPDTLQKKNENRDMNSGIAPTLFFPASILLFHFSRKLLEFTLYFFWA